MRLNNVLVTEAGVPAASPVSRARMFVDLAGGANSGVAMVNPSPGAITVSAEARDPSGLTVSTSSVQVPGKGHIAKFPTELGLNLPVNFLGIRSPIYPILPPECSIWPKWFRGADSTPN